MTVTSGPTISDRPAILAPELATALFDQEARRVVGVSGVEFLRHWDAGEFRDFEDTPEGRDLAYLILLIPFGRQAASHGLDVNRAGS